MGTYSMFGLSFFSGSIAGTVTVIADWIRSNTRAYVCVTGAHGVVESSRDAKVLRAHRSAGLVVPDGMPLVWLGKLTGYKKTERVYGPDLFLELCRKAEAERWGVFLYGTTEKTLRRLSDRLLRRYPTLQIVGSYAPSFRQLTLEEDARIVRMINASKARIVFVGLSTPKQELWMHTHARSLRANVLIGVGAAFDFVSGTKRQAPRWIQRSGLEWAFRLFQEPGRLLYRYTVQNLRFFRLVIAELYTRIV